MQRHWAEFGPPVYISVAGYLGVAKGDKAATPAGGQASGPKGGDLNELFDLLGGGAF